MHCLLRCLCAATAEIPKRKYTKKHPRFNRFQLVDGDAVLRDDDRDIPQEVQLERCTKKDLIGKVKLLQERLKDQEIEELKAKLSVGT